MKSDTVKEAAPELSTPIGCKPTPPRISNRFLVTQFWRDIFGKEVQSAATYSYLWLADQMGHIAIGIILQFVLAFILQDVLGSYVLGNLIGFAALSDWLIRWGNGLALTGIAFVVSFWEFRAYSASAEAADRGLFPLDTRLLRDNAIIATAYMVFGATVGYAFHLSPFDGAPLFIVIVALSVLCAPYWLRQKIVWQKAALPYLTRLADITATIEPAAAKRLQAFVDAPVPAKNIQARQVIIYGCVGSGRTPLACAIGTENAFKNRKARYISFDALVEISELSDDPEAQHPFLGSWGPKNIYYWPWCESQILIIDDISPILGMAMEEFGPGYFEKLLQNVMANIATEMRDRHTVWVFGVNEEKDPALEGKSSSKEQVLEGYKAAVKAFCRSAEDPLVIELGEPKGLME